jgi:transposase
MMGIKTRVFQSIVNVSLEDLVPADHFYRHVERTLDLSFVRDLVRDRYSAFGRPSIDPVVLSSSSWSCSSRVFGPSDSWNTSVPTA